MEENYTSQSFLDNDMEGIYRSLSVQDDSNFEIKNDSLFVTEVMERIFDVKFLSMDNVKLQNNVNLLNINFVALLKECFSLKFKKISVIYICYCDYFDLDYNKTYLAFQDKLQNLIKKTLINLVGIKEFNKHKLKASNGVEIPSLFDLFRK
jgi:hypothetical protein